MPLIVDPDLTRGQTLGQTTGARSQILADTEPVSTWLERRPNEHLLVLGPGVPLDAALTLAGDLRLTRPALSVILVRGDGVTSEHLQQAMKAGVREVVRGGDTPALAAAVARAEETAKAILGPEAESTGSVITVFSPKGGVGKTTVAVNTALALAEGGAHRVCLLDLDLSFGDVAITLQLVPRHTIADAVDFADTLDFSLLEGILTPHDGHLTVLAAPITPEARDRIDADLVRRIIGLLRVNFEYVVIDTAPSFEEQVLQALDDCDECVIVTTLDVPTLKNTKVTLETLDLLKSAVGHRWLVLNRADDEVGLTRGNVESILETPVRISVPTAIEVASATNHGRPILLSKPDHKVSRAIRELAQKLVVASHPEQAEAAPVKARRRLFAWARR